MKIKFALFLFLGIVNMVYSQDYIPLVIDSFHRATVFPDTDSTFSTYETYNAYSYNEEDSLVQIRTPIKRFNYSYGPNTKTITEEELDIDNIWNFVERKTFTYVNGKVDSVLTERYRDGDWSNLLSEKYYRDELGQDTLWVQESWSYTNQWIDWGRVEKKFDSFGNITNQLRYRYDFIQREVLPADGFRAKYDNNNRLITYNDLQNSLDSTGFFTIGVSQYRYDENSLLDSILSCWSWQGPCEVNLIETYDHSVPGEIKKTRFELSGDIWEKFTTEFTYSGPEVYGAEPDSILRYFYKRTTDLDLLNYREYHTYQELPNNCIYYHQEVYKLNFFDHTDWYKSLDYEAFYKLSVPIDTTESDNPDMISIYPNPVKGGEMISIDFPNEENEMLKILVYDAIGRLVVSTEVGERVKIPAPNANGMYTILLLKNGKLIGLSKQIVTP